MAKGMDAIAVKYPLKKVDSIPALPETLNPRVGLAVAAGDLQPLIIVIAADSKRRDTLEATVSKLAWDKKFAGWFTYATAAELKEIPKLVGGTIKDGVLIVEPDIFGAGGKVVKEVAGSDLTKELADAMDQSLKAHVQPKKTRRELSILGLESGIFYETGIPVSGKGEAADRERYKLQLEKKK
ncbi:hypothetical protein BH11PLA2_BH11PLA2_06820 [soil metagenome]